MSEPPRVEGAEPTRTLAVSVVGLGRWGKNLARVFANLERATLHSVCDLDRDKWATIVAETAKRSADFRTVLSDRNVEAIVIATPPDTHSALAVAAMEAGKHVLIEKPMALSIRDAQRIASTAERCGRRAMVGFVLQYHPAIETLRHWVASGTLGEIRCVRALRTGSHQSASDPGPWWSLAPHDIDLILSLFEREPTTISALASSSGTSTRINARMSFGAGAVAEFTVDDGTERKIRRLIVQGTRATALFDDARPTGKLRLYDLGVGADLRDVEFELESRCPAAVPPFPDTEPLALEAAHFVDGVLDGTPFRTNVSDGVRVVEILQSGEQSVMANGRAVPCSSWIKGVTPSLESPDHEAPSPSPFA